jgi:HD-GYP domain-containing protein (c-di-GMP phosphodiesterase class II)
MKRTFPLHVHIATLFMAMMVIVGSIIAATGFVLSREMLEKAAADTIGHVGNETSVAIEGLIRASERAVSMASYSRVVTASTLEERMNVVPLLREALLGAEGLTTIYVAYPDGDFFLLRRIRDERDRAVFSAPAAARYVVQSIDHGPGQPARGHYVLLDGALESLRIDERPDYVGAYDPRERPWYKSAVTSAFPVIVAPYVFATTGRVGSSVARATPVSGVVIGADIRLDTLGTHLKQSKATPSTEMALVTGEGFVLAHDQMAEATGAVPASGAEPKLARLEESERPVLAAAAPMLREAGDGHAANGVRQVGDEAWNVSVSPVVLAGAPTLYLVVAVPERELLGAAFRLRRTSIAITLAIVVLSIPVVWWVARLIARPLRALAADAEAVRRFRFSEAGRVRSLVKEVDELGATMDGMKETIRRFLEINAAVAGERNFGRLLPMLLRETLSSAEADFGVLYLADGDALVPMAVLDRAGAETDVSLPRVPNDAAGPLLGAALREGASRAGPLGAADIEATGLGRFAADPREAVAVPLRNRQAHTVGAMLILRREPVGEAQVSFLAALAASTASSLETRELIKAQKALFEAFIQLIAGAIDAKSPYTGGHCARVPELTKMLAQAACAQPTGPFRDFDLSEEEWEAVHLAAWLHDCGKVTTPDFVVDKATKLETIYDRIHEVRMRFEVLKRDAEIAALKAILGGADEAQTRAALARELAAIDDDFAFVASCNEGGEFMAPERVARLKAIATRTWARTLDDRVGISRDELERKAASPALALPAIEQVLSDKPEHQLPRRPEDRIAEDNPWGFRMKVPELLYDRGEVHNLSVQRGTLSEEERYKINEHIVQTLIMLSALPYPKHLRQVPEIAGGHHEKMDGTGYPRRLRRDQMSPVARMMAIADIFEALTAADRPYKPGKKLSEAVRIMHAMKKDGHVDPQLFDLFLTSGVYLDYARRFMRPDQVDAVDIAAFVTPAAAAPQRAEASRVH